MSYGSSKSSGSVSESMSSSSFWSSSSGYSSDSLPSWFSSSDSYWPTSSGGSCGGDSCGGDSCGGGPSGSGSGCPPQPANVTINVSGGTDVPPDTLRSFTMTVAITIAPGWTADDYAACWSPVGKLQIGAWADNEGTIGRTAVAPYDHSRTLDNLPQIGTTEIQDCDVILDGEELVLDYTVTNDPDDPAHAGQPYYTNPSSITGTVEVTWVAK